MGYLSPFGCENLRTYTFCCYAKYNCFALYYIKLIYYTYSFKLFVPTQPYLSIGICLRLRMAWVHRTACTRLGPALTWITGAPVATRIVSIVAGGICFSSYCNYRSILLTTPSISGYCVAFSYTVCILS